MTRTTILSLGRMALAGAILLLAAAPAEAQRRGLVRVPDGDRGGIWGSLGGGVGLEQFDARDGFGYSDRLAKPIIQGKIGGTVSQSLRLGVEAFQWFNSSNGLSERVGHFAGIGQFYPAQQAGFFVKGAAGIAFSSVRLDAFNSVTDVGFSYGGGIGYEVKVGRNTYIVPTVDYYQQNNSSGPTQSFRERFLNIGLNIQFQSGRRI